MNEVQVRSKQIPVALIGREVDFDGSSGCGSREHGSSVPGKMSRILIARS